MLPSLCIWEAITARQALTFQNDDPGCAFMLLCFVQGSELVGSVLIGVADILTDGIAYSRLLNGDVQVPHEGYYLAYATILCFGVITTALAIVYRLRNARLMRAHMRELCKPDQAAKVSTARRQAQQHEWELAQTHRTKVILSLGLVSAAAQGPSPLQASCMYRPSSHGASVLRDFCTAAAGAGCRFADVCPQYLSHRRQQRR